MMEREGEGAKKEEDPSDPREKRHVGEKKKKSPTVGTLTTATGTWIPVLLIDEKERQQLQETLQRSTNERRATNVPFHHGVGPFGLELQKKALEKATKRKATMEAARAQCEGISSQGEVPCD